MARQVAVSSEKLEIAQMEVEALTRDKKRLQQLLDQLRSGGLPAKGSGAEGDKVEGAEAQAIIRELRAALRAVQPQVKEQQVEINQLRAEREVLESHKENADDCFCGARFNCRVLLMVVRRLDDPTRRTAPLDG